MRGVKSKLLTWIAIIIGGLLVVGTFVRLGAIYHFPPSLFGYSDDEVRASYDKYCEHRSNYKRLLKSIPARGEHSVIEAMHKERDAEYYAAQALEKEFGEEWAVRGLELKP